LEVLKNKVGDCNEHAVLLTALLRAVGIPARVSVGLVYTRGKFFYHAWTEAYVGKWVSMDATLNQMPVDATHIKLVHGGLDKQADIIGLIGKLKLKVIDYRYD
jgi:transglutaminase-like putative cysteine protease